MLRRYTFKLYPTDAQEAALKEQARMCAQLWNALLEMRETHYRRAKQRGEKKTSLTAFDQGKDITALNQAAKVEPMLAEWRIIPRGTQERVADMLDLAMKAFFKRAKGGAGASSGYPRYKSTFHADSIPLREPAKSCWKFEPKNSDGGYHSADFSETEKRETSTSTGAHDASAGEPLRMQGGDRLLCRLQFRLDAGEPLRMQGGDRRDRRARMGRHAGEPLRMQGGDRIGRLQRIEERAGEPLRMQGGDRNPSRSAGEPMRMQGGDRSMSAAPGAAPASKPIRSKQKWRFTMRGIPGCIKARGKFPADPAALKTADVKYYAGAWWVSICADIERERKSGSKNLTVEFDLIDSFAAVKTANGQCLPGLSNPFSNGRKGETPNISRALASVSCAYPVNAGGEQVRGRDDFAVVTCADPADAGGEQVPETRGAAAKSCADPAGEQVNGKPEAAGRTDAIQSERDRRYKRGSYRWKKEKARIAKLKAREARQRKEALHRWSTDVIRAASELEIIAPPQRALKTGRGDEKFHGAEVKTVAALNRHVLGMAPAAAIQMLEYKAAEASVSCAVTRKEDHQVQIGNDLKSAAVTARRATRVTKRKQKLLEAAE